MRKSLVMFAAGASLALALPAIAQRAMFRDVRPEDFFAHDLDIMVSDGILRGYDDGRFGPNDPVTRGQIAAILRRYDSNVIQPLRDQIAALREEAGLGSCGDDRLQDGEQCDDGNAMSGDGCSRDCREEDDHGGDCSPGVCPDGYTYERCARDGSPINYFADPCLTHQDGEKCLSSDECGAGMYCTTEDGDCQSACPPGAEVCPAVCAGVCRERESGATSCEELQQRFDRMAASSASCSSDRDCMVFSASCPYVTCGVAIHRTNEARMQAAADAYTSCLEEKGEPISCAGCIAMEARCEAGRCVTQELR